MNFCLTIYEYGFPETEISLIHLAIFRLALGISYLKWDIFMFSSLELMYENPASVSGSTIFTMTKKIADQS